MRSLDFPRWFGNGVLHTKMLLVDGKHFYVGSANFDWRALTQVSRPSNLLTTQTTAPSFNIVISTLGYQTIQRSSHAHKNTWLVFCMENVWLHVKKVDIPTSTVICKYFSYTVNGVDIYRILVVLLSPL